MENQIEIYQAGDGHTQIKVNFVEQTIWLNQKQISALFGTEVPAINKHIKNICMTGSLNQNQLFPKWK